MDVSKQQDISKGSFWKKNNKKVPGRLSPKKYSKKNAKTNEVTSFENFQDSVNDAWTVDDDEFCIISGLKCRRISKKVSDSAALKVLNIHRSTSVETTDSVDNAESKQCKPGAETEELGKILSKPFQINCINSSQNENSQSKIEPFENFFAHPTNLQELCKRSWSGIPVKVRAPAWRLLTEYLPISVDRRAGVLERKRENYWNLVDRYYYAEYEENMHKIHHQIYIDVPRTNPSIQLFQQKTVQKIFERILFTWAIQHPASGYVQGINDLVTPFFIVFLQEHVDDNQVVENFNVADLSQDILKIIEADSFWCLSKFLSGIQDNYISSHVGIQKKVRQLEDLIKRVDETLHRHLQRHNVIYLQFSFRWLNNLLTRELPLKCIIRLWDTYLAEGDSFPSFQLYVCAAFLLYWRNDLLRQDNFQELILLLQNLPTHVWTSSHINMLVAEAYKLKFMFEDAPNHLQSTNCDS